MTQQALSATPFGPAWWSLELCFPAETPLSFALIGQRQSVSCVIPRAICRRGSIFTDSLLSVFPTPDSQTLRILSSSRTAYHARHERGFAAQLNYNPAPSEPLPPGITDRASGLCAGRTRPGERSRAQRRVADDGPAKPRPPVGEADFDGDSNDETVL